MLALCRQFTGELAAGEALDTQLSAGWGSSLGSPYFLCGLSSTKPGLPTRWWQHSKRASLNVQVLTNL